MATIAIRLKRFLFIVDFCFWVSYLFALEILGFLEILCFIGFLYFLWGFLELILQGEGEVPARAEGAGGLFHLLGFAFG